MVLLNMFVLLAAALGSRSFGHVGHRALSVDALSASYNVHSLHRTLPVFHGDTTCLVPSTFSDNNNNECSCRCWYLWSVIVMDFIVFHKF